MNLNADMNIFAENKKDETMNKRQLVKLFNIKKKLINEILLLKSAFSIIDQMFNQEMTNAEILKNRCISSFFIKYKPLNNPQTLNPFITKLMDPFANQTL